jgi:hypothetical protein
MDTLHKNITKFFEEMLVDLKCQEDTKSYIVGIYGKYKSAELDFSKDSITLLFAQARNKRDFLIYQNLGDWLFYIKTLFPEFLKNASENFYDNIARLSYYNCYLAVKSWKLYEQLSDEYIILTKNINEKLRNNLLI